MRQHHRPHLNMVSSPGKGSRCRLEDHLSDPFRLEPERVFTGSLSAAS